jgi:hypothetical protein
MLDAVTLTLQHVTGLGLRTVGLPPVVSPESPALLASRDGAGLSLWLYRVDPDPQARVCPSRPGATPDDRPWATPLRLRYLITALAGADDSTGPLTEQRLLARVLDVFDTTPVIAGADLRGSLAGTAATLQVHADPLPLEDLTRLWRALGQPYQLSLTYDVRLADA